MKISHRNVPYSDIPRLAKEGVIKVGTRVKACDDLEKYPNGFTRSMQKGVICEIAEVSDGWFRIQHEGIVSMPVPYSQYMDFFLDILSDEEEEIPCKICRNRIAWSGKKDDFCSVKHAELYAKPLSFSEPLTKEAVGRVIETESGYRAEIENISIDGEWVRTQESGWMKRDLLRGEGWHFESSEITIEEAEKLLNKKIKR